MPAVFALLIGVVAGISPQSVSPLAGDSEPDLAPVLNGAPDERRGAHATDNDTVGSFAHSGASTVTIERRIIIRIPTLRPPAAAPPSFVPRASIAPSATRQRTTCLSLKALRGASLMGPAGIVFVTSSDSRYRAVLERGCRPVDFQSGFYLSPSEDGAVCAGRDTLHARSGLRCTITALHRLDPAM